MTLNRRHFLIFLGATATTTACGVRFGQQSSTTGGSPFNPGVKPAFQPVKGPMPLAMNALASDRQMTEFSQYEVVDDLVLPEGFTYDVLASWGDKVGDSRFGYNNDYLALIETSPDEALMSVNFEYISAIPWQQTYEQVIGKALPLQDVDQAVKAATKAIKGDQVPGLNAYALPDSNPIKQQVKTICKEGLIDQGVGIIALRRSPTGKWARSQSAAERRITGISGLEDGRYLKTTGPAVAIFQKTKGLGYVDKLGDKIIGTFQNCAGGTTPWGTVFSAEENVQVQVPEPVYADGTSFDPSDRPFNITDEELTGLGNVFGLAGNKYGWMVELDPANPNDYGTKHTWLGRYRHEAVGVRVAAGKPLAFYSGCDRRGGHLYKFVSKAAVTDPKDKANSKLLSDGMLYVAQFQADGTGRWLPLSPTTAIAPTPPTFLSGVMLPLPQRPEGGIFKVDNDAQTEAFQKKYKNLGDLYVGSDAEKQGAILIDAHFAANAIGATCTARPEDTKIASDGSLFIAFTSGGISKDDGSPDIRIFKGPDGSTAYEFGWIMRLVETGNEPDANTFTWAMAATGGELAIGGQGFANPDNLAFDGQGNLWMMNDMSSDKLNREVPADRREKGVPITPSNLRGIYGNNAIWYMPLSGKAAGQPHLFGIAPMDCETTGLCFASGDSALFLSIQHPGEVNGIRQNMAAEMRQFAMQTTDGKEFIQTRKVPIGSNWPSKQANDPPKPSVVAIYPPSSQAMSS
ncbi:PhoX family phosphatase [Leptolyngbyaceae cyanobacterium UHCC 1019]